MKYTALILLVFAGCSTAAAEPAPEKTTPDYVAVADAVVASRKARAPLLPDDLSAAGRAAKAPAGVTAVHVYSPRWCAVCKRMERETRGLPGFSFTFDSNEAAYPAWVRQINSYPISVWSDSRGRKWHKTEWRGVDWFTAVVAAAERGA